MLVGEGSKRGGKAGRRYTRMFSRSVGEHVMPTGGCKSVLFPTLPCMNIGHAKFENVD